MWSEDRSRRLAINGGQPVRSKPWLDNLTIGDEERKAAWEVLQDGHLSLFEGSHSPDPPFSFRGGPQVQRLEKAWCEAYGARYAVSMNSATSGLYAAIGALGIGYGDEVIVSPYTMSACAVCPLLYGAIPIFADVQLHTGSLDPVSIEQRITERTRAILVVHQFGIPAEMDSILALARKHGLKVVEDCAQAPGARYRGRPVGTMGAIGIFSLNVNKTIQVGEGGICITNDEDLRDRLALIRNHAEAVVGDAGVKEITNLIGFNLRLTEIAAALGIEQLKKLDRLNSQRIRYVEALSEALAKIPFLVPPPRCAHSAFKENGCSSCKSVYYLYPLRFLPEIAGVQRVEFVRALKAEGVPFAEGYTRPLYLQPLYQTKTAFKHGYPFTAPVNQGIQTNYAPGACPIAERLFYKEMMTNEHVRPPHALEDVMDIARAIEKVVQAIDQRSEAFA